MSGPFFDRLNPFKGSTSVHPEGFRVSVRGSMGCPDTLLPCVHRKATLKTHITGQFISFSHPRWDFIVFCLLWGTVWGTLPHFIDWNSTHKGYVLCKRPQRTPFVTLCGNPLQKRSPFDRTLLHFTLVEQSVDVLFFKLTPKDTLSYFVNGKGSLTKGHYYHCYLVLTSLQSFYHILSTGYQVIVSSLEGIVLCSMDVPIRTLIQLCESN